MMNHTLHKRTADPLFPADLPVSTKIPVRANDGTSCASGDPMMNMEKSTILLVDSSATYLFYMAMLLKRLDYSVRTVSTAEDALAACCDDPPSLMMTDTALPDMSGVDLLKKLKSLSITAPVIVHSSEADPLIERTCSIIGCSAYFRKPAEPDALYRTIQKTIDSSPRQNIRITTSLKVDILNGVASNNGKRTEDVTALSEGGLYVRTNTPEPVNTVVPLKIFFRNRVIRATAEVHYRSTINSNQHREPGMGMQFISINHEDKTFVQDYIKERITAGLQL
jgi:CheY-like chemotaxis protein